MIPLSRKWICPHCDYNDHLADPGNKCENCHFQGEIPLSLYCDEHRESCPSGTCLKCENEKTLGQKASDYFQWLLGESRLLFAEFATLGKLGTGKLMELLEDRTSTTETSRLGQSLAKNNHGDGSILERIKSLESTHSGHGTGNQESGASRLALAGLYVELGKRELMKGQTDCTSAAAAFSIARSAEEKLKARFQAQAKFREELCTLASGSKVAKEIRWIVGGFILIAGLYFIRLLFLRG